MQTSLRLTTPLLTHSVILDKRPSITGLADLGQASGERVAAGIQGITPTAAAQTLLSS